jgi:YHYH protein
MKILYALFGMFFCAGFAIAREVNLVQNPGFEEVDTPSKPVDYEMKGAAFWGLLGSAIDFATHGIIFPGDAPGGGSIAQMVRLDPARGRWIDFRFRGLAEDGFSVTDNSLKMKIEFYSKNGADYLDCASLPFYDQIETDRKNLTVNGDYHKGGAAVWRSYELEELLPFKEVDAVKIIVSYDAAQATTPEHAAFLVDDFSLVQHDHSVTGRVDPADRIAAVKAATVDISQLVSLGGRWYYEPAPGEIVGNSTPLVVTGENADRLFYKSDRLINPFLDNMTAWLRAGYKDEQGNIVTQDRFVPDNVVLTFKGDGFLTLTSKNLPNHPTAKFPGFNPSYIQEMTKTYKLPLEPVLDPDAKAMTDNDSNHALPMGPIGVAVNGVVFFNPFDASMRDASNIMDYCCGHPNPLNQYHYHKYPICVNTPFVDKGDAPSQVIGFAFDGLPIYGPYQEAGVMAKDSTTNPLNDFNACYDDVRGWHYHVTPGKFPYLIGGYFAKVEAGNIQHFGPPGGGNGPPPFPGPRGFGPPPRPPDE